MNGSGKVAVLWVALGLLLAVGGCGGSDDRELTPPEIEQVKMALVKTDVALAQAAAHSEMATAPLTEELLRRFLDAYLEMEREAPLAASVAAPDGAAQTLAHRKQIALEHGFTWDDDLLNDVLVLHMRVLRASAYARLESSGVEVPAELRAEVALVRRHRDDVVRVLGEDAMP